METMVTAPFPGQTTGGIGLAHPPARCRNCGSELKITFADLGMTPLANSFVAPDALYRMEPFYPLRAYVCNSCMLVQLEDFESPENIFTDYLYFSSYSASWLDHARRYVTAMIERFALDRTKFVVEVASNDGYLSKNFALADIPCLGIEPAENVAMVARAAGVPTHVAFFGTTTAAELATRRKADLMTANNVLAHVPDINDFVEGFRILLAPQGVATFEFQHLARLIENNQYDTIYHEHFSYLSLLTVERIFAAHRLAVFDVEELPTHGGSLRVYSCHAGARLPKSSVTRVQEFESRMGLGELATYQKFAQKVIASKVNILSFFIDNLRAGQKIIGYGAPAKGNTLLNFCGIGSEFLEFTVDRSPHKQGRYLPGTRIEIRSPQEIFRV